MRTLEQGSLYLKTEAGDLKVAMNPAQNSAEISPMTTDIPDGSQYQAAREDWVLLGKDRCRRLAFRENHFPAARLGDSFYFAVSKIVESLLRRGARVPLGIL